MPESRIGRIDYAEGLDVDAEPEAIIATIQEKVQVFFESSAPVEISTARVVEVHQNAGFVCNVQTVYSWYDRSFVAKFLEFVGDFLEKGIYLVPFEQALLSTMSNSPSSRTMIQTIMESLKNSLAEEEDINHAKEAVLAKYDARIQELPSTSTW